VASHVCTVTNINVGKEERLTFVGLQNYQRLIGDPQVWESLGVTLKYAALSLPIGLILPFSLALLLNSRYVRGTALLRVLWVVPYVVPFVAGVLIWQGMLNSETGWINQFLR